MSDSPHLLSAVILTWNSRSFITGCLEALAREAARWPIELFVVDNGSTDGTAQLASEFLTRSAFRSTRVIRLHANFGTTRSRNLAFREATGESVLVLDSDTEVLPGAVEALVGASREGHRVGIVAPRLLAPNGTTQAACKRFPTLRTKLLKVMPVSLLRSLADADELYPRSVYEGDTLFDADYCISAAWLVNRSAMQDVGLLDERIFYAPEDVDYCLRMWARGWRVVYNPNARVIHHTQRVSYRSVRMMGIHARGLAYYFRKHGYLWSREGLYRRLHQGNSHED